jgi:ABC-type spermidine/putrescine transport system permease subunit I
MAKLERKIGKIRRIQPTVAIGGSALLLTMSVLYWFPLMWWLAKNLLGDRTSLPADLPFLALVERTLIVSVVASSISVIAAYPLMLIWRLSGFVAKQITVSLMVIPMVMGLLARNYSWLGMLASNKPLPSMGWSWLGGPSLMYTRLSVYIVMTCVFIPISFFILIQGASYVSQSHLDAAKTLGTPDWKIVLVVVLPLTFRAAALAFGLTLAMSVGFFITPHMIGGGKVDFISNVILTFVNFGRFGLASKLALNFVAIMIVPATIIMVYAFRRRRLVSGR